MITDGNTLPTPKYDAKKIIYPMGMEYKMIYACPNGYLLYKKEFEGLKKCLKCGLSWYKHKTNNEYNGQIEKDGHLWN